MVQMDEDLGQSSQFLRNCTNFTVAELKRLDLVRSISAAVCLLIIVLILLLLLFYKAYKTIFQRLFFYLTIVTVLQCVTLVFQVEHLWQYSGQEEFCKMIGYFVTWTGSMVYLYTFVIIIFLLYKVYEKFRGELCPTITRSSCCRVVSEIGLVLFVTFLTPSYLWVVYEDGTFGNGGAWCWMKTVDKHCHSTGFVDVVVSVYILVGLVNIFSVVATLILAVVFCILAHKYRGLYRQHMKAVRETLLLLVFLLASVFLDSGEIALRFYIGITHKRTSYSIWMVYAIGPPFSKIAFPVGFLVYLYSIKKFRWEAIKRAANDWKQCCSKCCPVARDQSSLREPQRRVQGYRIQPEPITQEGGTTVRSSYAVVYPSHTSDWNPPYTDEFTDVHTVANGESRPLLTPRYDTGYSSVTENVTTPGPEEY